MEKATIQKRIAAAIRKRRESLGFSQESFADSIGMHRAYYGPIELGKKNLTLHTLSRVAAGLKWDIATLAKNAGV